MPSPLSGVRFCEYSPCVAHPYAQPHCPANPTIAVPIQACQYRLGHKALSQGVRDVREASIVPGPDRELPAISGQSTGP